MNCLNFIFLNICPYYVLNALDGTELSYHLVKGLLVMYVEIDVSIEYASVGGETNLPHVQSHDKGDIYLQTACATICQVYAHSPVFRIGGDEFAAVLQHREYENRDKLMELFDRRCFDLRAVSENPWEKVNIARGMAVYDPDRDQSVEDVVRRADQLMYEHKRIQKKEFPAELLFYFKGSLDR